MKKYLPHIFIVALILGWTGVFGVEVAQAQVTTATTIAANILAFLGNKVLEIMSLFVWISGLLLDYSLQQTLNIANLVNSIPAIEIGWKVFRDLCTMFFIFILLYTAITTVLGVGGGKENAKKVIASVVIAGLLINFSLFFTKIVIDTSNLVSLSFYKALVPKPDSINPLNERTGLSAIFMQSLYIQTVYDPGKTSAVTNDKLGGSGFVNVNFKILINAVMGSIVMLIASIVFLAASFFFIVRLVTLLLLMVTSPIAFAGEALGGKLAAQSKRWREALIDQCLFMPAYLAITYVGVKIIASTEFQNAVNASNGSFSGAVAGGSIGVIFNYLVVIVFLMASLIIAKEFGVKGAETFSGWANNVGMALPRLMGTGGSVFARNTLGWAGNKADKYLEGTVGGNSAPGRALREITTGALASNKFFGSKSFKDQEKTGKEIKSKRREIDTTQTIKEGTSVGAEAQKIRDKMKANPSYVKSAAEEATIVLADKAETTLNSIPASEIVNQPKEILKQNADKLNDGQIEAILKNTEKFSEEQKADLLKARFQGVTDLLADLDKARGSGDPDKTKAAVKALEDKVRKGLSDQDIENLGYERLKDQRIIDAMSWNQNKALTDKKTKGYSKTQKEAMKQAKLQPLKEALGIGSAETKVALDNLRLKPEDIVELDGDMLKNPNLIQHMKPDILAKMIEKGTSQDVRDKIREEVPKLARGNPGDQHLKNMNEWLNGVAEILAVPEATDPATGTITPAIKAVKGKDANFMASSF
jgi:hypothetical protein